MNTQTQTQTQTQTPTPTPTTTAPPPGLAACGQLLERVCRYAESGDNFDRTMTISSLQTVMSATGRRSVDPSEVAHLPHQSPLSAGFAVISEIYFGPCPHLAGLFPEDDPLHDALARLALALGVEGELTTATNPHAL